MSEGFGKRLFAIHEASPGRDFYAASRVREVLEGEPRLNLNLSARCETSPAQAAPSSFAGRLLHACDLDGAARPSQDAARL